MSQLYLDSPTKSLEIILGGAVATNQLPFVVGYADLNQTTFAQTAAVENDGQTNGGTAVTLAAAPAVNKSRYLKFLSVYNADTTTAVVTIRINNNGTFRKIWSPTLQVGDTLLYLGEAFGVYDSSGSLRANFSFGDPLQVVHGGSGTAVAFPSGSVVLAGASGIYTSDTDVTFSGDTLTATKLLAPTSVSTPSLISTGALTATPAAGSNFNVALSTTGDFAVNTSQLYVDTSTGFVGINVIEPLSQLHVVGGMTCDISNSAVIAVPAGGSAGALNLQNTNTTAGNTLGWKFNSAGVVYGAIEVIFKTRTGGAEDAILAFTTIGGGTKAERVRINELGQVGINVTNPGRPLDIQSNSSGNTILSRGRNNGGADEGSWQFTAFNGTTVFGQISTSSNKTTIQGGSSGLLLTGDYHDTLGLFIKGDASNNTDVGGIFTKYKNINTTGWGIPAVYGYARPAAGQTAAVTLSTYTVGAADGSFLISANINVTTSTLHNFTVTCVYTDESNVSRTFTFGFSQLAGATLISAITNATGAGPYESPVSHIRCIAGSTITIATVGGGGFTTVTYNGEGHISQIA